MLLNGAMKGEGVLADGGHLAHRLYTVSRERVDEFARPSGGLGRTRNYSAMSAKISAVSVTPLQADRLG
jgi:hypothetical protein